MNHREAWAMLEQYLDGALPAVERWQVTAHLDECAACRAYLAQQARLRGAVRERLAASDGPPLHLVTTPLHTVHALDVEVPRGRLTAVTGVSGSGKTTLVLESLVPALQARIEGRALPGHVTALLQ